MKESGSTVRPASRVLPSAVLAFVWLLAFPLFSQAASYYVAPNGSDFTGDGSVGNPWETIQKARDSVRALLPSMSSDVTVYLRGGVYPLSSTLTFGSSDSGLNGFNVVYKAYPGEKPMLSGGRAITGWTSVGNGIHKASVDPLQRFRHLYVNGKPAIRARQPNGSFNRVLSWDTPNQLIEINAAEIANWSHLDEVEMVTLHHWIKSQYILNSFTVSGASAWVSIKTPFNNSPFVLASSGLLYDNPYYFENAYEFIDSEGEWYLDTTTHELFYKLRAGEDVASLEAIAPAGVENLLRMEGTLDSPIHHLQFHGLAFAHSDWLKPSESGILGSQVPEVPGAIHLDNAHHILLERNVLFNLGTAGINLHSGSSDNIIRGNVIKDIAAAGIAVDETRIKNPPDPRMVSARNVISNNFITRAAEDYGSSGIVGGFTDSLLVEHNEISDLLYTGISVGASFTTEDTQAMDNIIRYNRIHRVLRFLDDGGGIYTLGKQPGMWVGENYVYDVVHELPQEPKPTAGIYLDNGSSLIMVKNNAVENVPIGLALQLYDTPAADNTIVNFDYTCVNCSLTMWGNIGGNTFINDGNIDLPAIKANAGIEPAYQDILFDFSLSGKDAD